MATKRWNSNKVKMNGLGGNAASVDDIKDAGLWGTVQDTPLVKGADGKTYAEMPAGWSNVNGNYGALDKDYVEANRGSFGSADNAYTSDADWSSIQKYKDDWKKAYEAGDQAGMDAAHNAAQAIRANYGYSGGADGSQYNPPCSRATAGMAMPTGRTIPALAGGTAASRGIRTVISR